MVSQRAFTDYHCQAVTLTVYSHVADKSRAQAIRNMIEGGAQKKKHVMAKAVKAAASSRKTAKKIEKMASGANAGTLSGTETEMETEAFFTEAEDPSMLGLNRGSIMLPSTPLWLPFSMTLVSRWPVYNLMSDCIRLSWARHHQDMSKHSLAINRFLNLPAEKPGTQVRVPADPESDVSFVCEIPGRVDLQKESFLKADIITWPLFSCLSSENLLTALEIGLSPLGRIAIISQHPLMVSIAVETMRTILEPRGWAGISHTTCHARDVK